jgi:hypothetical protein
MEELGAKASGWYGQEPKRRGLWVGVGGREKIKDKHERENRKKDRKR